MKGMLLALALLMAAATARADSPTPAYELFLIEPGDIVKTVATDKGDLQNVEITLSASKRVKLLSWTQRNMGKPAMVGMLEKSLNGSNARISLSCIQVNAPITDGVVHLTRPNPHRKIGILLSA